ncbi:hypothetical protein DMP17_02885 [Pseudonocardia sp. TMWB2A]
MVRPRPSASFRTHQRRLPAVLSQWVGDRAGDLPFLLIALICMTFLLGGSARSDALSTIPLRLLTGFAFGFALWRITIADIVRHRGLAAILLACVVLIGLHLVPLPYNLWSNLPGHAIVAQTDKIAGLGQNWRALSLAPSQSWNALFAFLTPLTLFLLGASASKKQLQGLLPVILILGLVSACLGVLQLVGSQSNPFYLYRITNGGFPVGLFANRNHNAMFLSMLIPLLVVFASQAAARNSFNDAKPWMAAIFALFLFPMILVAGSRAGLLGGTVAAIACYFIYKAPETTQSRRVRYKEHTDKEAQIIAANKLRRNRIILFSLLAVIVVGIAIAVSRASALTRLLNDGIQDQSRLTVWAAIWEMAKSYFPFGSGIGSFVEVYKLGEPTELLTTTYLNHAHNDWLEIWLTTGVAGVVIALAALAWTVRRLVPVWFTKRWNIDLAYARAASIIVILFAIYSIGDYPVRAPSMACLLILMMLWLDKEFVEDKSAQDFNNPVP